MGCSRGLMVTWCDGVRAKLGSEPSLLMEWVLVLSAFEHKADIPDPLADVSQYRVEQTAVGKRVGAARLRALALRMFGQG